MNKSEEVPSIENQESRFDWRLYFKNPESLPMTVAEKLDAIVNQLNDPNDAEMVEIKKELEEGIADRSFRHPIGSLVNMFRPYLGQEEKAELNKAIREVGDRNPIR